MNSEPCISCIWTIFSFLHLKFLFCNIQINMSLILWDILICFSQWGKYGLRYLIFLGQWFIMFSNLSPCPQIHVCVFTIIDSLILSLISIGSVWAGRKKIRKLEVDSKWEGGKFSCALYKFQNNRDNTGLINNNYKALGKRKLWDSRLHSQRKERKISPQPASQKLIAWSAWGHFAWGRRDIWGCSRPFIVTLKVSML